MSPRNDATEPVNKQRVSHPASVSVLTAASLGEYRKFPVPAGWPSDLVRLWSPRDDVHGALIEILASAKHSVVLNMYGYDDDELDAIIRAKAADPSIYVQMSLDSTQAGGKHEKAILGEWGSSYFGTSIAIGQSIRHAISHLKVLVVDGEICVTGSTNWSASGEGKQDNELTVLLDPSVCAETRSVLDINHAEMIRQMQEKAERE